MTNPTYTKKDYERDIAIRDGAPKGAFAVDHFIGSKKPVYICLRGCCFVAVHDKNVIGTTPNEYPFSVRFRSLSDINHLITFYEREQKLIEYVECGATNATLLKLIQPQERTDEPL